MTEITYTIDAEHDSNDWDFRTIRVVAECEWLGTVFSGVSAPLYGCRYSSAENFARLGPCVYKDMKAEAHSHLLEQLKEASELYPILSALEEVMSQEQA